MVDQPWKGYNIEGLCNAARDGQLEDVKEYIQNGVNVNDRYWYDHSYCTPLDLAHDHGHSQVVEYLLSKGAEVNNCKKYNIKGLCDAASDGRLKDVKKHVQNGVHVNKTGYYYSPLDLAHYHDHSQVVEYLLSKGAKVYNCKKYNIEGLCDAAGDGRLEDVKGHVHNGVEVNGTDRTHDTPLNRAMRGGHTEVVKFLLSQGAEHNIRGLCDAAGDGRLEDVKGHVQNGVDVNRTDRSYGTRDTPLNRAMKGGHAEVVKFLLSQGAKYNIRGLCHAAGDGRLEDVKKHVQNGVDVNGRDQYDDTPLDRAYNHGHCQVIEFLLSNGAKGKRYKQYNIRGLCNAVVDGRLQDVKEHVQNGVDVNGTYRNDTPLDIAYGHGHCQVVEFLLSSGAKVKIYNKRLYLSSNDFLNVLHHME